MIRFAKKIKKTIWFLTLGIMLTGCSEKLQPVAAAEQAGNSKMGNDPEVYYSVSEEIIDTGIDKSLDYDWLIARENCTVYDEEYPEHEVKEITGGYISKLDRAVFGDNFITLDALYWIDESDSNYYRVGEYLSVIKEEKTERNYLINVYDWNEESPIVSNRIIGINAEGFYLLISRPNGEACYIGFLSNDGVKNIICEVPREYLYKNACIDGSEILFYSDYPLYSDTVYTVNIYTGEQKTAQMEYEIYGSFYDQIGNSYLYGFENNELYISDDTETTQSISLKIQLKGDVRLSVTKDENDYYITDGNKVWSFIDGKQGFFRLSEYDLSADAVYGLNGKDGGFVLYSEYEAVERKTIFTEAYEKHEKKEVRLAFRNIPDGMDEFLTDFNRNSKDFRVTVEVLSDSEEVDKRFLEIQNQLTDGTGPDIISEFCLDNVYELACRGVFEEQNWLKDQAENDGDIIKATIDSGIINGKYYGTPFIITPLYCITDKKNVPASGSWSIDECIDRISSSDSEYFGAYGGWIMDKERVIKLLGLYDTSNTELIDWDNHTSNLEGETFVELLKFAKEYGFDEDEESEKSPLKVACECSFNIHPQYFFDIECIEKQYEGEDVWIGYPREDDSSAYIVSECLFVTTSSDNKEESKAFLEYLISSEGQEKLSYYLSKNGDCYLTARYSVIDSYISSYNQSVKENSWHMGEIAATGITEEGAKKYKDMVKGAKAITRGLDQIELIISEELGAYVSGQKSAEDVAEVIDSRVQLYLDENAK